MAYESTNIDKLLGKRSYESSQASGDFRLRELTIHSPSNANVVEINSASMFIELNIYEDLFSNVLKGTYVFLDTQGHAETIPIIGDETLIMTYTTPAGEGSKIDTDKADAGSQIASEEALRQRFKIYDCTQVGTQEKTKIYKIFFVSEEYVFNSKTKVSKGYKGRKYSHMVKDVLAKLTGKMGGFAETKKAFIEETATPQNIVVPNWTPFQAINFFASRSVSEDADPLDQENTNTSASAKPLGSLFMFYEKLGSGFFYESIESIILKQKAKGRTPLYQYAPKTVNSRHDNLSLNYFAVDKFEIKSSFKTLEDLNGGMFGSKLIAYDPIRMKYDEVNLDYYEKSAKVEQSTDDTTGVTELKEDPVDIDDSQRRLADFIATDIDIRDKKQNKLISTNSDYIGSNDANIKLATTTRFHDAIFNPPKDASTANTTASTTKTTTSIGVSTTTFKDQDARPNRIEDWLLQRQMQIQEFGSIIVNFTVPGNSSRHVGDLIRFEIPTGIPDDSTDITSVQVGHQLYSGYYLISKIRHIITKDSFDMDVELIKNSFAKRIQGQITEESTDGTSRPKTLFEKNKDRYRRFVVKTTSAVVGVRG